MRKRVKEIFLRCEFTNYTLPREDQIGVMFFPVGDFDLSEVQECFDTFKDALPPKTRCMGFPREIMFKNLDKKDVIEIRDSLNRLLDRWNEGVEHDSDSETRAGT
jgi:hypothetical protein